MLQPLQNLLKNAWRIVYGAWVWTAFLLCVTLAILCAMLLPGLERRRRWVSFASRLFFRLAFIPATVTGMARLPAGSCIVVANHASYLDGMILQAYLPARFAFVIKSEVTSVPVLHFVLRRIGSIFVERHRAHASSRDARNLVKAAAGGACLGIFPEGTFTGVTGLGRFRAGASVAAIRAEVPLVPVVIRGSRDILPAATLLPCRGRLEVEVVDPILPDDGAFASSSDLTDAARQRILERLGEPDLSNRRGSIA